MRNKLNGILFGLALVALVAMPAWGAFVTPDAGGGTNQQDPIGLTSYTTALESAQSNSDLTTTNNISATAQAITVMILGLPSTEGGSTNPNTGEPSDIFGDVFPQTQRRDTGAVGTLGMWIGTMYENPPADTQSYVADVMNSANIATPAYAQGLGFQSLNPVLSVWKKFRDMAYTFFVLIFLVIGFLIMTRRKVGGQVVVTAQQAIPQVIIALLAVTFSYAIAGLMIDIMYLVMYLLVGVFNGSESLISISFFGFVKELVEGGFSSSYDGVSTFVTQQLGDGVVGKASGFLGGLGVAVIIAVAILFSVFSLFFELLKTYVSIVLSVAMAPLILMFGALPGRSNFGRWLNDLFGNLMAFPTVLLILLMFDEMTGGLGGGKNNFAEGGFSPPYLFGLTGSEHIVFMLGIGMILIMTELVKQSKKAFGVKGGVFEQFAGSAASALSKGWKGGQLVPGVGATDLSKYGVSGKQIIRGAGVQAAGAGAGIVGAARGSRFGLGGALSQAQANRRALGARAAEFTGSDLFQGGREDLKKRREEEKKRREARTT